MTKNDPTLHVDLSAIAENYNMLRKACPGECGATVKADAYGLGAIEVTRTLIKSGCTHFFVGTKKEGFDLRQHFPNIEIYVFSGALPGEEEDFIDGRLLPVLNSIDAIEKWRKVHPPAGAILHIDTGMNRLGLDPIEAQKLVTTPSLLDGAGVTKIMTHLSHASCVNAPENDQQLARFATFTDAFPMLETSIANSAGILNGLKYCGDLARPGIAIYGGSPYSDQKNPMRQTVRLTAPLLQKRYLKAGDTVGYDGLYTAPKDMTIGAVGFGYADGAPRALNKDAVFHIDGVSCSVLGRMSMDLLMVDLSNHDHEPYSLGQPVELIGKTSLDQFAAWSNTISYEILTGLGQRVSRRYI